MGDLTEEDFLENWGNIDENDAKQFCPPQTIVNIKYTMELVKLAKICGCVLFRSLINETNFYR